MDKSIITRELQILLEAINEQFEIIREYEDFIPQIEFDMIVENVRKLYETFRRLQRLNDPLLFVEKKIPGLQGIKNSLPAHQQLIHVEPLIGPEPVTIPEPVMESIQEPSDVPTQEIQTESPGTAESHIPPTIPIRLIVKKKTQSKRPAKTAEPELFASEEPVFNIKLKEAREKSLGPKIPRNEIFKAAIGINDKFMFINELFDGNLREYNESIETLGGFKTLPPAQEYLDLLRRRNNWNSASNAFGRIKELVENRF
jgi:hypothetical protein